MRWWVWSGKPTERRADKRRCLRSRYCTDSDSTLVMYLTCTVYCTGPEPGRTGLVPGCIHVDQYSTEYSTRRNKVKVLALLYSTVAQILVAPILRPKCHHRPAVSVFYHAGIPERWLERSSSPFLLRRLFLVFICSLTTTAFWFWLLFIIVPLDRYYFSPLSSSSV